MTRIYFYEMSNIDQDPITIDGVDNFIGFCNRYGIEVTKSNLAIISKNRTVHAICKVGKPELVLSGDYKNLRKNFSKSKKR